MVASGSGGSSGKEGTGTTAAVDWSKPGGGSGHVEIGSGAMPLGPVTISRLWCPVLSSSAIGSKGWCDEEAGAADGEGDR